MSDIERTESEAKAVLDAVAWPTGPLTVREKHFIRLLGEMREDRDRWRDSARGAVALIEQARYCVTYALNCPAHPWHGSDEARKWLIEAARLGGQ
jgi:hypothetical protein